MNSLILAASLLGQYFVYEQPAPMVSYSMTINPMPSYSYQYYGATFGTPFIGAPFISAPFISAPVIPFINNSFYPSFRSKTVIRMR